MRSLYATSLLVMGSQAARLNPSDPSPGYNDWFEHPNWVDAEYYPSYDLDVNQFVNAVDAQTPEVLVKDPKQYWVENWFKNSAMPIKPDVKWDDPVNLSAAQK